VSRARWVLVILLVAFAGIQAIRANRDNPPIDPARTIEAVLNPPKDVDEILTRACGDCHSNATRWPWYTNVAPLAWWIADHVHEGRSELNLSDWAKLPAERQARKLEKMCRLMQKHAMPLASYRLAHGEARLSTAEIQKVCDWAAHESERLGGASEPK
jgi:hypothetical protein